MKIYQNRKEKAYFFGMLMLASAALIAKFGSNLCRYLERFGFKLATCSTASQFLLGTLFIIGAILGVTTYYDPWGRRVLLKK